MKKIIHIHPAFSIGGIEAMIVNLANEMSKSCDTTVCSIYAVTQQHVLWHKLSSIIKRASLNKTKAGFSLREVFRVYFFLKKNKYDVVYLHGTIQYYLVAIFLLWKKMKFVYTVHSDAQKENSGWGNRLFVLKRFFFRKGWVTPVTISNSSKESFYELYGCNSELICNGIVQSKASQEPIIIKEIRQNSKTKIFIHPARITEAKNQLVLCKVFNRLIIEANDIYLIIAGPNDDKKIYNEIKKYFSDRIRYIGASDEIIDLLSYSDALCLPSIWEGLPVVLLEAMSQGCVPICSPVGGMNDIVKHQKTGILSKSSKEQDYYNAVKLYLSMTHEEQKAISEHCKAKATEYSIEECAIKYINLISK